jgi:hypothetical protein
VGRARIVVSGRLSTATSALIVCSTSSRPM